MKGWVNLNLNEIKFTCNSKYSKVNFSCMSFYEQIRFILQMLKYYGFSSFSVADEIFRLCPLPWAFFND